MPIDLIQKLKLEVDSPKLVKLILNTFMRYNLTAFSDCQMTLWVKARPITHTYKGDDQKLPIIICSNDRFYNSDNLDHKKEKTLTFLQKDFTEKILPKINTFLDAHLFDPTLLGNYRKEYLAAYGGLGTFNDFGYKVTANENGFIIGLCSIYYAQ